MDLVLNELPPFERHKVILKKWDALPHGENLRVHCDHDPRPLHFLFEAEYKGLYKWEFEQEGPPEWIVNIRKIKPLQ